MKPLKDKPSWSGFLNATIRELDLLKVSYEKYCAHDRNFDKEVLYTLVYPDGTEILIDVSTNFEIQQEIPPALSLFSTWRLCSGEAKRKQEFGNVTG